MSALPVRCYGTLGSSTACFKLVAAGSYWTKNFCVSSLDKIVEWNVLYIT